MAIEKNAVLGDSQRNIKTASRGCPICGQQLDTVGSLPRCPTHGTAPFEYGARITRGGDRPRR